LLINGKPNRTLGEELTYVVSGSLFSEDLG